MKFVKSQRVGNWINFIVFILTIVSWILYQRNVSGEGYFNQSTVPMMTLYMLAELVLLLVIMSLAQLDMEGMAGKVLTFVTDLFRILVPVLFIVVFMNILSARLEGFAFIYFSNEEVLHEVQSVENLSSAHGAIANLAVVFVAAVVGMIAAFFNIKRKNA